MRFQWDANKDRANQVKHGVDFATAALVFADPHIVLGEDRTGDDGEQRWHALGLAGGLAPLLVVSCLSGGNRWRRNYPHHLGQKSQ